MKSPKIVRPFFLFAVFAGALAIVALVHTQLPAALHALYPLENDSPESAKFEQFRQPDPEMVRREKKIAKGGKYYKRLLFPADYPGVDDPEMVNVNATRLDDSAVVIGIVVEGQPLAFARDEMTDRTQHIVNLMVNKRPVSVTYCNIADCVRVLTRDDARPIDLHTGGLDVDNQMVYLLNGERYGQMSADVPLKDHDFEVTTLGDWKKRHPDSKIYDQAKFGMDEAS